MKDRTLKSNLYHSLGQEVQPKRLEETINYCTEIMKEQMLYKEELTKTQCAGFIAGLASIVFLNL